MPSRCEFCASRREFWPLSCPQPVPTCPHSPAAMNICFERRIERPDVHGRCVIRLVATFDNQRLRFGTGEKCVASEWNEKTGWFRKSFADIDNATLRLRALRTLIDVSSGQGYTSLTCCMTETERPPRRAKNENYAIAFRQEAVRLVESGLSQREVIQRLLGEKL